MWHLTCGIMLHENVLWYIVIAYVRTMLVKIIVEHSCL